MTIQTPTRITIEIQPATSGGDEALEGGGASMPFVRVLHDGGGASPFPITVGEHRETGPLPTAYEPGPCLCLDDEDCGADHGND
jgi:hypothetical protein